MVLVPAEVSRSSCCVASPAASMRTRNTLSRLAGERRLKTLTPSSHDSLHHVTQRRTDTSADAGRVPDACPMGECLDRKQL